MNEKELLYTYFINNQTFVDQYGHEVVNIHRIIKKRMKGKDVIIPNALIDKFEQGDGEKIIKIILSGKTKEDEDTIKFLYGLTREQIYFIGQEIEKKKKEVEEEDPSFADYVLYPFYL